MSHFRTTSNKLVLQIYLNAISCSVLPNRVPFGISFFLFCSFRFSSSNTSIFSESIFWSSGKYRNCLIDLIVWDRSTGAPYKVIIFVCLFIAVISLHVRYVNGIPESEKQFACGMRNRGIWISVILLEESGILLMIGICTLTAIVMVFRSRWSNFRPYRLKIWPRLWRSDFWPVLLTGLLNARIFNRSKICPGQFVRCHVNEGCL